MLCSDILSVAFGNFFKVPIAMTRVMPKAFSLEVVDNLEPNNYVSGSSYCFHCSWLLVFKCTTLEVPPALHCLLFIQKEKKEKEVHLV